MGKKKSVALIVLISIVMFVLAVITAFPKFTIPGTNEVKEWNPAVLQYDLGSDFGGGYYAYYYPQGVITETEYKENEKQFLEALNEAEAKKNEDLAKYEKCKAEYDDYVAAYKQHGTTSLYLSTSADDGIYTEGNKDEVSEGFTKAFDKAVELVTERFEARAAKTGSSYNVSVVDDYAIRVQISTGEDSKDMASSEYVSQAFSLFSLTDKLYFMQGEEVVSQLVDEGSSVKDLIKSIRVKTKYEVAQLQITFTDKGKEMLESYKSSAAENASTTLNLTVGTGANKTTLLQITSDAINTKNEVQYGVRYEEEKLYAETLCILVESAMEKGGIYMNDNETTPFTFSALSSSSVRVYGAVEGEVFVWVIVAVFALIVLAAVCAIVKMGGFGVVNLYTTITYFLIAALSFAFISGSSFIVSYSSILVFIIGLALTNVLNAYIYNAIKKESALGKTIGSSVRNGYNKTALGIVDIYAVLLLGALALLIGTTGLTTVALQAIICVVAGAFCNLAWGRALNVLFLSASKDKYKYFRLVREDDDDE